MIKLVLQRHGESIWNRDNNFAGWSDIPLTEKGIAEAQEAGRVLKEEGYAFDIAFTSVLERAYETLKLTLKEMRLEIPIVYDWRLNERHYGALQGLNRQEMVDKEGYDQVMLWRRSYDVPPPALDESDERHPANIDTFKDIPREMLPATECLKDVVERVIPFWNEVIVPALEEGKKVFISAHGNSLRALVKYLDNISDEEIPKLNIAYGAPLVYELDDDLKPIKHYYLGDQEEIQKELDSIKSQTKANN